MTQPPLGFPNWEELYKQDTIGKLPWYWPTLDPDLEAALRGHGLAAGRVLDQGTGPGTQAIALAERGFVVTVTDASPAALAYAAGKANEHGVEVGGRHQGRRNVRGGCDPGQGPPGARLDFGEFAPELRLGVCFRRGTKERTDIDNYVAW
jgi:SAM-dependent methyltransferase